MWKWFFVAAVSLALAACAKYPDSGGSAHTKRLIFSMKVDGKIRTGLEQGESGLPYVYLVALRLSTLADPTDLGPIPVVQPSGNGFVAGNATHFILFDPLASPNYQIWKFRDKNLNEYFQTGIPVQYDQFRLGDNHLRFEVDLSQLVPADEVDSIQSIQANFLTMNNRNTSGGGRVWDALGDRRIPSEINSYFSFRMNTSRTYDNATTQLEPQGDAVDPDLDITDWSIEVRLP